MLQHHGGEPADVRSVIERAIDTSRHAIMDRLPTGVVQRYVELEMSRAVGPVAHGHGLPLRPTFRVHARIGWDRFLMVSTGGSGVGAAAVVDADGRLVELTTLAHASSVDAVTPVSGQEALSILCVLVAARPTVLACVGAALAGAQEVTPL